MGLNREHSQVPHSPPGILLACGAAVLLSFWLIYKWLDKASVREAPGIGRLGLDAKILGPRTVWPDIVVPERANSAADSAAGELLFQQWCVACHGEKGAGDGILAKALDPPPRNFTKGRFRFRTTPEGSLPSDQDLYRSITAGILPSRMPSFGFLTSQERWNLVDRVKALSEFYDEDEKRPYNYFKENPAEKEVSFANVNITADAAAVERGKTVFLQKGECWKCHGKEGLGDGPSAATLVTEEGYSIRPANLRRGPAMFKSVSNAKDVYRVLKLGVSGTPMPSYGAALQESELTDVAIYTESLWRFEPIVPVDRIRRGSVQLTGPVSNVEFGEQTFLTQCAGCHGKAGRGDGVATEMMKIKPASLASGIFKYKTTPVGDFPDAADLKRTLRRGIPGSSMPAWNLHSEAELDAIVAFLQSLSAGRALAGQVLSIPPPPGSVASAESAARGKLIFIKTCVVCHGEQGYGDGPFAKILQDYRGESIRPRNLREEYFKYGSDPSSLFRVISYGFEGTPMPGFAAALDESQRWDLVSFVLSLRANMNVAPGGK